MTIKPIVFGDDVPGTIVHDFQAILDIIGKDGLRVPGERGLFPIDRLVELNSRMARPISLTLKRPQLRSYPNLTGLYMLLRSSGMASIEGHGARRRLLLNDALLNRWIGLSPADRYWNLLGVWWALSHTTGIDDREDAFSDIVHAMEALLANARPSADLLTSWAVAASLMGMFGMAEVTLQHNPGVFGWKTQSDTTPLGSRFLSLFTALMRKQLALLHLREDYRRTPAQRLRVFQRLVRPVARDWHDLLLEQTLPEVFNGTLRVKVSLPDVWRRFDVPSTATLDSLAWSILKAFRFDSDHLFEFRVPAPTGETLTYTHFAMDEGIPAATARIGEVPFRVGQKSLFHYDFGDDWKFSILIEAMEPRVSEAIKLIASEGKAPRQYPRW